MKKRLFRLYSGILALTCVLMGCTFLTSASADSSMWVTSGISDPTDYDYSFAIVGDTQKLVPHYANKLVWERGDTDEINYKYWYDQHEYPPNDTFVKLYDYIVNNSSDKKIAHVFGLGDITERASVWEWVQKGCPYAPDEEFSIAVEQFIRMKEAGLDFSLTRGNHDSWDSFNKHLGTGEASDELDYAGMVDEVYVHPNGTVDYTNTIHYFSAGNLDYMVVALDYGASDAVLSWAGERIEANPYKNVIITTHAYMYRDGTTIDTTDVCPPSQDTDNIVYDKTRINNGDDIWNKLISRYPNIVLAMSGHDPTEDIVMSQWQGVNGNVVTNVLIDPQGMDKANYDSGCVGAVAMFYFSNGGKTVDVRYWSVAKQAYIKTNNQFTFNINTVDADYTVVNNGVATLPQAADISLNDYAKVRQLMDIYNDMSAANKAKVTDSAKLTQAYAKLQEMAPTDTCTITWNVDGATSTTTVSYGEIPTFSGSTYKYGKSFAGWATTENGEAADLTYATGNQAYYAVYSDVSVWDGYIPVFSDTQTADALFEGAGTKDNPYLIQSATDLVNLSALTKGKNYGNSSIYFKQTVDIDLTAGNWQPICTDIEYPDNKWTQWYKFSANYDGDNHTITLKEASMKLAFGLFGALDGSVSNLVIDGSIKSIGFTGALVSQAHNGAVITNVTNKASINATGNQIGGLIGNVGNEAYVTLTDCKNEGNITVNGTFVGGIFGGGWANVKLYNCANTGNVRANSNVGGLGGELWMNGDMKDCTNSGTIMAGTTAATKNLGAESLWVGKLIGTNNITNTVTITWNVDGTTSTTQIVHGNEAVYGSTPTKAATDEYTYKFVGWATSADGEPVAEKDLTAATYDATYYAIFEAQLISEGDDPVIDPDNPGTDPDNPGTDPDNPGTDPDNPGTDPELDEEPEKVNIFVRIWRTIVEFFVKLFGIK